MNDQTIEALIGSLERILKQTGIETLEDAGAAVQRLADILNQVPQYCDRERLAEVLKPIEVTAEDEMLIRGMTENFPAVAVALLEEALPVMRKEFPVINAGRPKSLTTEQQKGVCEYIGRLYGDGVSIKTAKQRAAQRFGVSRSTVERTWAERKRGHKPTVREIVGILKAKQSKNAKNPPPTPKEEPRSLIAASTKTK
jgi:hypothetical protein